MFDIGDVVTLTFNPKDSTGAAVDPTTVVLTVTLPDATTATPSVTHSGTGVYTASYTPAVTGLFRYKWVGTGANPVGQPGTFMVWPESSVLSVDDAKTFLNITATTSNEEIRQFITRAEAAIAARTGPLIPTATTSVVEGRSDVLILPVQPVISVTSITPTGGSALGLSSFTTISNVISWNYKTGWFPLPFYTVVYQAGRTTVPADLYGAVQEMLKHLWATQRGGATRPGSRTSETADTVPGAAYLYPFRVEQVINEYTPLGMA